MPAPLEYLSKRNRVAESPATTFGDVTYGPGGHFGPRRNPAFQLVVILAGEAVVWVDGEEHHLPGQHVALLQPGTRDEFAFSPATPTRHTWCTVQRRRLPRALAAGLRGLPFCLPLGPRLQSIMELGLSSPVSDAPSAAALLDLLGEAALWEYLCAVQFAGRKNPPLPEAVRRARECMHARLAEPLTMAEVARAARCSSNHLTHLFRQHLSLTPARYLWQARVNRGVELLRQTGLSVTEIAERTGFQNPFHFSRLVKRAHRFSPRALRERMWRAEEG